MQTTHPTATTWMQTPTWGSSYGTPWGGNNWNTGPFNQWNAPISSGAPWHNSPWQGTPWNSTPSTTTPWINPAFNATPWNTTPWNSTPWIGTPWNGPAIYPTSGGFNNGYGTNGWSQQGTPSFGFGNGNHGYGYANEIFSTPRFGSPGFAPWNNSGFQYGNPFFNNPGSFGGPTGYGPWNGPQPQFGFNASPFYNTFSATTGQYTPTASAFGGGFNYFGVPAYSSPPQPYGHTPTGYSPQYANSPWNWSQNAFSSGQSIEPNGAVNPFGNHTPAPSFNGTPTSCAGRDAP